ncbi:hypothetical protein C8R46DRAFT_1214135 [Mycena filopes]|nr:hypothetical protein C8R46DRAFT_1214135 [Mycena filopes]
MSGRISVYGFPFVGKLVFFPVLIAVSSFLFVPVQPLHRDKEAFNDDWNEFNDLRYSANKFRPSTPHPTRLLGRISVRFPLIPLRVFVPVQLFYRDMEALKDDWNDFNDLGHSANKFGASHPLVRSNIRSVSCSSLFYRDMDAFNDDWNDFNDLDHSATRTLPMPTRGPASFSFKDVKLGKKLPLDVVPPLSGVTAHPSTLPAAPFSGTITSHKGANGTFASQSHSHLAAGLSGFATRVLLIRMYRPVCNGEVGPQVVVAVDERNAGGGCVVDLAATSGCGTHSNLFSKRTPHTPELCDPPPCLVLLVPTGSLVPNTLSASSGASSMSPSHAPLGRAVDQPSAISKLALPPAQEQPRSALSSQFKVPQPLSMPKFVLPTSTGFAGTTSLGYQSATLVSSKQLTSLSDFRLRADHSMLETTSSRTLLQDATVEYGLCLKADPRRRRSRREREAS